MKDILQDVVSHTHSLGFITTLKVVAEQETSIESMAEDRSVVLSATTHLVCQILTNLHII